CHALIQQLLAARLDDRAPAGVDGGHFVRVDVDAHDRVAIRSERSGRDAPDISKTKHRDLHDAIFSFWVAGPHPRDRSLFNARGAPPPLARAAPPEDSRLAPPAGAARPTS